MADTQPPLAARIASLHAQFPGREPQIDALAAHLTLPGGGGAPLFVHGPPGGGKTDVVRALLAALGARHAYVDCAAAWRPRALLSQALHQLRGGGRRRADGYALGARADGVDDFVRQLPAALAHRPPGACGDAAWLVLDGAHRLAGGELLPALARARELSGAPLGLVLISEPPWAEGRFMRFDGMADALAVAVPFPAYTADQLARILEVRGVPAAPRGAGGAAAAPRGASQTAGEAALLRAFLGAFVPAFARASACLPDVAGAAAWLFPRYAAPALAGAEARPAALYGRVRADVARAVAELDTRGPGGGGLEPPAKRARLGGGGAAADGGAGAGAPRPRGKPNLELPYMSKFLLVAAYVASRNKASFDRAVFDPTLRRGRRGSALASDRAAEAAAEAALRGGHAFPPERLLQLFWCLHAARDDDDAGGGGGGGAGGAAPAAAAAATARRPELAAEVQMQVASLVALRLLSASGGDPLGEGAALRCAVTEGFARACAENVGLRLEDYLKYS